MAVNISLPDFYYDGDYQTSCQALRLAFERSGFVINNLECESDSVNRVCQTPTASPYYGVVKVDDHHSVLSVKDNGQLKSGNKIDLSQNLILKNIEKATGLDKTESLKLAQSNGLTSGSYENYVAGSAATVLSALADEVNKIMANDSPYKVYVYGDTTHWPGATDYLNSRVNAEVEALPIREALKRKLADIWPEHFLGRWLASLGAAFRNITN